MPAATQQLSRSPLYEHWRWRALIITWLAYAGFYLTRKSFAVAKIDLADPKVLGLSMEQMGFIDGAYLTAYAVGQFLWGFCGDHFGARKVILLGLMGSVISAIAMGASSTAVLLG